MTSRLKMQVVTLGFSGRGYTVLPYLQLQGEIATPSVRGLKQELRFHHRQTTNASKGNTLFLSSRGRRLLVPVPTVHDPMGRRPVGRDLHQVANLQPVADSSLRSSKRSPRGACPGEAGVRKHVCLSPLSEIPNSNFAMSLSPQVRRSRPVKRGSQDSLLSQEAHPPLAEVTFPAFCPVFWDPSINGIPKSGRSRPEAGSLNGGTLVTEKVAAKVKQRSPKRIHSSGFSAGLGEYR